MNKIKIPYRFRLFGHRINVNLVDDLIQKEDARGIYQQRFKLIKLQNDCPGYAMQRTNIEQTYLHEVVHAILGELGYSKLTDDEQFVDQFASCLHQVFQTSEYEE